MMHTAYIEHILLGFDEQTGRLLIVDHSTDKTIVLDRDEAATMAERLQDWLLNND